ncbi:FadR/GntR family transcriptional regulator [Paraburkholderia sediminicola]|uniref:FadR/GntR family transcriptional regulator n=1 Tax=Paraburkholderia sediminicola TaxID=458836 RepID=UPI0038B6F67B
MYKNKTGSTLTPITGQSVPEAIVRRLTESILAGGLRPGDKLPREEELARSLGVAPMTLRSALASLRELGLVETIRGRLGGTYVCKDVGERLREAAHTNQYNAAKIRSLTDWRRAISGEASFLAAKRGTKADFTGIVEASREFDQSQTDSVSRRMADSRLHTSIAQASKSDDLLRQEIAIQEQLNNLILPLPFMPSSKAMSSLDHSSLISAIVSRDGEKARQELFEHVESTYGWCMSLLHANDGATQR